MTLSSVYSAKQLNFFFKAHTLYLLLTMSLSIGVQAEQLTAAIAANFAGTIKQLKPLFEHESGHHLITSFASSGL